MSIQSISGQLFVAVETREAVAVTSSAAVLNSRFWAPDCVGPLAASCWVSNCMNTVNTATNMSVMCMLPKDGKSSSTDR